MILPALLVLAATANPQAAPDDHSPKCAPLSIIAQALKNEFNEEPSEGGRISDKGLITLFLAPNGKTFTLTIVFQKDGELIACLLGAGEDWGAIAPAARENP